MSTRGAVGFKYKENNNEIIKATYNHSDSYPQGLGREVCEFISFINGYIEFDKTFRMFKDKVKSIIWVNNDEKAPDGVIQEYFDNGYSDLDVSDKDIHEWYCLLRNTQGANALYEIFAGRLKHLIDGTKFLNDSLFCEWAYILDLDNMDLIVLKGFQEKENGEYDPCAEFSRKSFYELKTKEDIDDFINSLEKEENNTESDDENFN